MEFDLFFCFSITIISLVSSEMRDWKSSFTVLTKVFERTEELGCENSMVSAD